MSASTPRPCSDHPNGLVPARQSRMANVKVAVSAMSPDRVVALFAALDPEATICWARHDEPGKVPHAHFVVRFRSTMRWTSVAQTLHDVDGHEYAAPAQSWRRSVRYLLHLDNPDKGKIPRDAFHAVNMAEEEADQLLGAAKLPILQSLALAERLPLSERFAFLVIDRGHQPSEVSAALRCMLDLERWSDTRTARQMHRADSALPDPSRVLPGGDLDDADPFPDDDGPSLLDDDADPFSEPSGNSL